MRGGSCILVLEAVNRMTLIYADGSRTEAFLLARTENRIRVAIPGSDDPLEFTDMHGTWVSEDCEPVCVEFAWQGNDEDRLRAEPEAVISKVASFLPMSVQN